MFCRPILEIQGGVKAYLAVFLISGAGLATAFIRHRLFWRICKATSQVLNLKSESCVIEIWPDTQFKLLLGDPYWAQLLAKSYRYEPDFEYILSKLKTVEYAFFDCGANYGYWSIFVSSGQVEAPPVIAVEAAFDTYQALSTNCQLNHSRFRCLHLALSNQSGQQVAIEVNNGHAGAHITALSEYQWTKDLVTTTTLDDLLSDYMPDPMKQILIKLDVEGQEIAAFQGAKTLLKEYDPLFYYEDHGKDVQSEVTRFILEVLGLQVFYCRDDMKVIPINSWQEASHLKTRKAVGYNFWACKENSRFLSVFMA